tara:strand:- start:23 stop:643 length:621 start_codon:yes stop_codon:yes gene_type:complete
MPKKQITLSKIIQIFGECEIQDERGIFMPLVEDWKEEKYDIVVKYSETAENFDKDHTYGRKGEEAIRSLIEDGKTIEVKTERDIWMKSGNVAIEFRKGNKEWSGISITKADWWFCVLDNGKMGESLQDCAGFFYPVKKLREKVKPSIESHLKEKPTEYRVVKGGDDNNSLLVLVPIKELFLYKDNSQEKRVDEKVVKVVEQEELAL